MSQALTIAWAQWRMHRNYGMRNGAWLSYIFSTIWYGVWLAGGVLAALVLARPDAPELTVPIGAALLLMCLYWQGIPMLMAASGLSLELSKLKVYPIPMQQLFGIEVLLRATAAFEMVAILLGATAGLLFNPVLSGWRATAAIPFTVFHLLLALGLRDAVLRVFSKRRIREVAALLFLAIFTVPRLLFRRGSPARQWLAQQFSDASVSPSDWPLTPWTATAQILLGNHPWEGLTVMLGWCVVAAVFSVWQFRATYAFDVEAARSAGENATKPRLGLMERIYRLPSTVLADPSGALVEKELRYHLRAPRFRMLFLASCVIGIGMAPAFYRGGSIGPGFLTLAGSYGLLMLGEVCVWNTFGFDRSAAQLYFLAPIRFSRVLAAKNAAAAFWASTQIAVISLACKALRFPLTWGIVVEAATVTAVAALFLFSVGNYVSVNSARPSDPESAMRSKTAGGTQALLIFVLPLMYVPAALAYFARWAFSSDLAFYAVLGIMGAIGVAVYWVSLDSATANAERKKEAMVEALSAGRAIMSS